MVLRLALLFAVLTLALAGCGEDGGGDGGGGESAGGGVQEGGSPTSKILEDTYEVAKSTCSELPVERAAKEYGLPPSATEDDVAAEYAELYQSGPDRDTAFDGCIAGLAAAPPR